jgi:hypothetical protein
MNALLLCLATLGQVNYDLIAVEPISRVTPTIRVAPARPTLKTAKGTYDDPKVTALADARARVREYARALAEARSQVAEMTQDIAAEERIPTAEPGPAPDPVRYESPAPAVVPRARFARAATAGNSVYSSGPVSYSMPVTYESAPATSGSGCYSEAAPATSGSGCYSTGPGAYSTPLVYESAPATSYMTYAAAPVTTYAAAPAVALGSGVSTYRERTRVGLLGRVRSSIRATSRGLPSFAGALPANTFAAMPAASYIAGGGFYGAGAVCTTGNCGF